MHQYKAVWIENGCGNTGTIPWVDGTTDNPVHDLETAKALSDKLASLDGTSIEDVVAAIRNDLAVRAKLSSSWNTPPMN